MAKSNEERVRFANDQIIGKGNLGAVEVEEGTWHLALVKKYYGFVRISAICIRCLPAWGFISW